MADELVPKAYSRLWSVAELMVRLKGLDEGRLLRLVQSAALIFRADENHVDRFCEFAQKLDQLLTGDIQASAREYLLAILDHALEQDLEDEDLTYVTRRGQPVA